MHIQCIARAVLILAGGWLLAGCQNLPGIAIVERPPLTTKPAMPPDAVATRPTEPRPLLLPASGAAADVAAVLQPVTLPAPPVLAEPDAAAQLRSAPDLWGRLRRGFAMPPLTHELVDAHARRFAASGFLPARADRIRLYLPMIVEELEQRRLPLELALLPMVESALNPQARSPVGALGLWQFMAPTARQYELRTSRLVDDRKNLREATRAAMDYLQKLHGQFGDWHLAMAAYNWGEGNVARAIARQQARGLPADFNGLAPGMPAETRNYVPQILALARLVAMPIAFGASLPDIPDGNPLVEVALNRDMDLSLAARMAGLSERDFMALNPAVKAPLVLASATPRLLLPQDAASRFEKALAAHTGKTASWSVQRLRSTQPVDSIAARAGVTAAAVRAANDIPRGHKPLAGSTLLLPVAAPVGSRVSEEVVAAASLQTAPDVVKVQAKARAKETLAEAARRLAVDVNKLAQWNAVGAKRIKQPLAAGRYLTLWVPRERAGEFAPKMASPASKPVRKH